MLFRSCREQGRSPGPRRPEAVVLKPLPLGVLESFFPFAESAKGKCPRYTRAVGSESTRREAPSIRQGWERARVSHRQEKSGTEYCAPGSKSPGPVVPRCPRAFLPLRGAREGKVSPPVMSARRTGVHRRICGDDAVRSDAASIGGGHPRPPKRGFADAQRRDFAFAEGTWSVSGFQSQARGVRHSLIIDRSRFEGISLFRRMQLQCRGMETQK